MSFIPLRVEKKEYSYSKVRFLEREHGIEYLPFEFKQMKEFADAKKHKIGEITGFISWSKPPFFLLLPTKTTPNAYIICEVESELKYPSLNQYVTVKGKWTHRILNNRPEDVLLVTDVHSSSPDFGKIKPDISYKDFVGILFEKWRNLRETTQLLIAQGFVSSPTIPTQRAGGLTLTLANYTKRNTLRSFCNDLRRFIPQEFSKNKRLSFGVPEFGIQTDLPKFRWNDHVTNFDNISQSIDAKLDRIPTTSDEYSITLVENTMGPLPFEARGLVKSDYPLVIEEYVEKRQNDYDVSNEIFKYLMVAQMYDPVVSLEVYNKSLEFSREQLIKFINVHQRFTQLSGQDQFMDLGNRGKPLSIHNLSVSIQRGKTSDVISLDDVSQTTKFYFENLQNVMDVQEEWLYDKLPPAATLTYDERRAYVFFADHEKSTIDNFAEQKGISRKEAQRIVQSLLMKHLLYEPISGHYSAVPIDSR